MELRINCKGCGASLHYKKTDYGKIAICEYCRQEYQIFDANLCGKENNGRILIEFDGQIKEFYIGKLEIHPIFGDMYREIDGTIIQPKPLTYKTKINLIEI